MQFYDEPRWNQLKEMNVTYVLWEINTISKTSVSVKQDTEIETTTCVMYDPKEIWD